MRRYFCYNFTRAICYDKKRFNWLIPCCVRSNFPHRRHLQVLLRAADARVEVLRAVASQAVKFIFSLPVVDRLGVHDPGLAISWHLKARSYYSDQQLMQCVAITWNFSIFTATHCISHWSQQNRYSVNEPTVSVTRFSDLLDFGQLFKAFGNN